MIRPVAISQRVVDIHGSSHDALDPRWHLFLKQAGLTAIPVANAGRAAVEAVFDIVSPAGVVLSGGNDVSPGRYGGARHAGADNCEARDETEALLIDAARDRNLPVVGICRGAQMINIHFKGGLTTMSGKCRHAGARHRVELNDDVARMLAAGAELEVNSYHRSVVTPTDLATALQPVAVDPEDGSVEGFRHRESPIWGFLWHPEREEPFRAGDVAFFRELFK